MKYHVWTGNKEIAEILGFTEGKDGSYYKIIKSQMTVDYVRMVV